MKKILILEPESSGHHLSYLDWIVNGAIERQNQVIIGTTHSVYNQLMKREYSSSVEFVLRDLPDDSKKFGGMLNDFRREYAYWKWARLIVKDSKNHSEIFLPYMDYMLNIIGLLGSPFGSMPFGGICMRASFHHSKSGIKTPANRTSRLKEMLFLKLLTNENLRSLYTIDETLVSYFENVGRDSKKLIYLPDPSDACPTDCVSICREKMNLPSDSVVVLIYGAISRRKGVFGLIDYLSKTRRNDVRVVLAGRQDIEVEEYLSNLDEDILSKVHQINRRILDEEESFLFNACDFVWVVYDNHYTMSGLLVKAAQYNKVSVVKDEGLIGWLCRKYQLGFVLDEFSVESIDSIFDADFKLPLSTSLSWLRKHATANAKSIVFK